LGSSLGPRPSYAWRSIWGAKPLLKKGLLWGIGDGSQVQIQGDKWIPSTYSHKIQISIQGIHPIAIVSDLINYDINW
jgi:hypothetical protein